MRRPLLACLAPLALAAAPCLAHAQAAPAPSAHAAMAGAAAATSTSPDVGQAAPDFSAAWANASGAQAAPVALHDYRGRVVVLAFYPKDRSSGCTAELTKFRDEFGMLFGDSVTVLAISGDSLDSHVSWATDAHFPFALVADPSLDVAAQYGARMAGRPFASRMVFVVGKDGTIAWRNLRFNALSESAYTDMAAAVAKARGN